MKTKLTFLLTSLLLAVGWANVASAQALPGNYADRLGIGEVTSVKATKFVKKMPGVVRHAAPALQGSSVKANAPLRANNKPDVVYPKAYYDTLTYSWSNPTNGQSGTDVPSTQLATDPYQIYELLRFVYMDKRFPGPYYSAYTSNNVREREVYYGGMGGGWDIPFGSASGDDIEPVGDITITASSYDALFRSITVYDESGNVLTSWNYSGTYSTVTDDNGDSFSVYDWPNYWSSDVYLGRYYFTSNYTRYYVGYLTSGTEPGSFTIPSSVLNGATYVRVVVNASYDSEATGTTTLDVNGETKTITGAGSNFADYTWELGQKSNATETTPTDVLITTLLTNTVLSSITITDENNNTITSWSASTNGATLPDGWYSNTPLVRYSSGYYYMNGPARNSGGTIRIDASKFAGYNTINVRVVANNSSNSSYAYVRVCDNDNYVNFTGSQTITRTINFPAVVATDTYKPNEEGYTALLVQVKNTGAPYMVDGVVERNSFELDKDQLIAYIRDNIKSVQLLTDGMRIGEGEDEGTVFNCTGTYNKFFFLGKGQARKKSSGTLTTIGNTSATWPEYTCEQGPFKFMFEEFSPTGGEAGSQITDFYMEMMDGNVYDVVHDCASVIQNGHQFSMSGNTGTQEYAMSGMNFFIPDYRLKYWLDDNYVITYTDSVTEGPYNVDGRDMNPYMLGNATDKTGAAFRQASDLTVNYAQYNKQHAPKVGIYVLTLDAEANPCEGYDIDTNHNYVVTLDWTSSLNEMSGHDVPQTYVVYEVISNEDGSTTLDSITTVVGQTHYDFDGKLWPQGQHSQAHNYIIMGYPTDNHHPSFIAWSNEDAIVIPGLNDFLELGLTHYESDFDVPNMKNWYRNFLTVDNDGYVGLTTQGIFEGDSVFNLLRFENTDSAVTKQVAQLKFENQTNGKVKYTINYVDEYGANTQNIEAAKYELTAMNIPTTGYLSIKHDKDIIIQPNGYDVNFLSITVQAGSYNQTWTSSQSTLPNGWSVSDGSMWVLEDGAYYLEGGGYILIDASVVGNYSTATVTINAYGDPGKTAKISVNGTSKALFNGTENARDYTWTLGSTSGRMAPMRATTTEEAITWWDYNETPSQQPQEVNTDWVLDAGGQDAAIDEGYGFWFNNTGSLTIPASYFENYTGIRVEISYAMDPNYTGTTGGYITVNGSRSTATTSTTFRTYSWTNVDASNGIVIVPSTGYLYFKYIKVYGTRVGGGDGPVQPTVDGVIRMANLRIVDQFAQEIPNTNDHPYRYTYFLKLANGNKESSMVPVPVQHTGAKVQGYYTEKEMLGDTIPANFLTEEVLSAQVDMNLSPSSAPYFYTINSKKNGVPAKADDYATYLNVLQRRSAGDYQEMQTKSSGVVNPMLSHIYQPGDNNFFDFRKVCAQQKSDSLSYVPIVWTNGISRHYFTTDSLHNSYGAPIWETRVGDVTIVSSNIERQATVKADGTVVWNSSVNWYDADSTQAYSLYMVSDLQAQGVLPVSNIEYEPYMFRLWLVDTTQSLRGYRWEFKQNGDPLRIVDAPELTPANGWLLLDTKMCENADDLTYFVTKNTQNWANNLMFGAKISDSFKPKLVVRFYYKVKGAPANGNMLRGINDKDNVGYVVLKGTNPHDPSTGVIEIVNTGEVVGHTYYNTLGQSSDRPFQGINIVVTRYSDGTTSTSKVRY